MNTAVLLPLTQGFILDAVETGSEQIVLHMRLSQSAACCPLCHHPSMHQHSAYVRSVADLPWADVSVVWRYQVRRFYCDNPACTRRTFTEQMMSFIPPHARRTARLHHVQQAYGFALGGEAGARLAAAQHMPISPDSLLRWLRQTTDPAVTAPRVVGIDDWALRKGQRYGTLVIDLEKHKPIALLPDRTTETVATWLQTYPTIEIVARDRATAYGEAIAQGAPQATQVADRWHLLQNLREAVQRFLERHHAALKQIPVEPERPAPLPSSSVETHLPTVRATLPPDVREPPVPAPPHSPRRQPPTGIQPSRNQRFANFQAVKRLAAQGETKHAIARKLHLHRNTVSRYVRLDEFPEFNGRTPQPSPLAPYLAYLEARWQAGERTVTPLWANLQAYGYTGPKNWFIYWLQERETPTPPKRPGRIPQPRTSHGQRPKPRSKPLSARQAAWLVVRPAEDLTATEHQQLTLLKILCPEANVAYALAQNFRAMVREHQPEKLCAWLNHAKESGLEHLHNFAIGVERDRAAVMAGLKFSWSNGPTEGHVNRLKLIKRTMYGRANFDLLQKRVLHGY